MIGRQLGHYRILSMLGAGGMGEVYRAHDQHLDRDVALKLLPAGSFEDTVARARLVREARAAAALNHASICTIHDVGEAEGQAYIAMELVDGRPLGDVVDGHGLPLDDVLGYGVQIAEALVHAHARGVIHRDLKSANVIVTDERRVKVLDFGLAKKASGAELGLATTQQESGVSLTERGTVVGTIANMAPEQLRGDTADARSDLWAFGVMLYEMCAGARPFQGRSSFEVSSNIINHPPMAFPPATPPAMRAVIERCLEKDPSRRYQTAGEARAALQAVQQDAPSLTFKRDRFVDRRKWAAIAAVLLAGIVAGLYLRLLGLRWPGAASRVESIAVLPMVNMSGDAAQDYFADGITEVLSTDLARLGGFKRVIARGSVIRYKGTSKPLEEIARELKVDALVTGSVLRAGNRVSITAQLLDPATGTQLWTNRYERDLQDVLVLRNEIVSAIVREIKMQLSPIEAVRLASAGRVNTEAFEAYLKGRFHWLKQTREDFDLAERYFDQALEHDSAYALAYAGLGSVWMMRGDAGFQPPSETFPKANAFMARALALDDSLAEVHVALANNLAVTQWDWAGAEREYRRAIEINPNFADAHFFNADLMLVLRRPADWNREIQRALELDPLNEFNWCFYGWQLNYVGRYDEAIPIFRRLLLTGPNKSSNYLGLWGAYYRKGLYDQALAAARDFFSAAGDGEFVDALGTGGDRAAYQAGMKRAGEAMVVRSKERHVPAIRIARMFAHAGETNLALDWLERAYDNRESPMLRMGIFWDWQGLRSEPRFQDLLRRLNLPQ
jgi:eukaryotic-like serine/threonine-protein kinase